MIAKVIKAVDSLNSIGIAYNNLKPENIYVTSYTAKQMTEIKLIDAKAVGNLITTIFYDENNNARLGFENLKTIADVMRSDEYGLIAQPIPFDN
ncbi:hypothetical protein SYNPS1DRAFT_23735 [Syncephalis pseudoplumigaleata]|uniref:Protein kinase domain-containing protein n=1 Tax=Syncephalis pseudoplumigaleata TaxID=1712513 RepID=A0A4P9YVS6_9FUNG|nr:hypothetical protein SYNPS1DRAFT_23735 [Syncephalis pseudoplumigaleata]|eukprot:RKP24173.1 hypothetical protein SYNPS1DRAFT_23735 [Syncephalis pseudoplumigaleata]